MADKNGIQLTSWQALKAGMTSTGKVMLNSLLKPTNLVIAGVGAMIAVLYKTNEAVEEVRERADELSNTFNNNKSDIEGYKDKIEDLYKTINNSGSSLEEVATARQNLMTVQDELIDKFGDEKETIDLITQAIYGQSSALDELIQKQWQETKNEFNESNMWKDYANWQEGYSDNIDRMVNEMENAFGNIKMSTSDYFSGEYDDIIKRLEEAGWEYSSAYETFVKGGSVEDLYEEILNIQTLVGDDMPENFLKSLTDDANELKATLDNYEGMWDNYILNDKIFADDNLADSWKEVNDAYTKYQNAVASGDKTAIEEATSGFATSINEVLNDENVSDSVKDYFKDMYPALYREVEKWEFKTNIIPEFDTSGLQGKTQVDVLEMLQTEGTQDGESTFNSIIDSAIKYGLILDDDTEEIQKILDLLVEWGILQGTITDTAPKNPDEITVLDISSTVDQLNTQLKPTIDSLAEAYQNIFTEDGFTRENIGLDMFSSIREELDNLQKALEESGSSAVVDYSAYEKLVSVLNDSTSTAQQVKDAFDEVALSVANVSITGLEDFEVLKESLEQLGYIDADLVAFEALVSNIEALKTAGLDLADTSLTESDFISFVDSLGISAEYATQAVDMLTFAQQLNKANSLDTSASVSSLLNLANNAGYTGEIIQWLTQLMKIYNYLEQSTLKDPQTVQDYIAEAEALTQKIKESAGKINVAPNVDKIDWKPAIKSAGKAGKDTGKSYKEALEEELSNLGDVISYVGDIIGDQIDLWEDQKDAAVDALEAERDAAIEALEAQKESLELQKEAIEDKIEAKEKEIKAIQDARKERQAEIDLQKKQYDLERLQNQKTRLIYKEGNDGVSGQMVYETDLKEVRNARESVDEAKENLQILAIEKEIDVLEESIDVIDDQIEHLDKQIENINNHYDKLIKQTEAYYDSMIQGLEDYKSRWEELANIEKEAKMQVALKNLGIETTDILNMSEDAFNTFKNQYLSILTQMYNGETDMINAINSVAQGLDTTTLESGLTKTKENIDKLNNADFTSVKTGLDSVSTGMTSVGNSASTASEGTTAVSDDLQKMNQSTEGLATKLSSISTALDAMPTRDKFDGLAEACTSLGDAIQSIANALGVSDGSVSGLVTALQDISSFSLMGEDGEGGIISQFTALKSAIDEVTSAINGGGGMNTEATAGTTASPASGGEGEQGGGSGGLTGAIKEIGTTTDETMGAGSSEGGQGGAEGNESSGEGVLGKFSAFKESVDAVTKAIGTGEEKEGSEEGASTLIGALQLHYEKAEETLPQVKSRFVDLLDSITACVEKLAELAGAMSSLGVGGGGIVLAEAKALGTDPSKSFSGMVGKAFAKGTGAFKGLPEDTLALRSEYGQPETTIYPDGTVELTNSPTLDMLPKGTQILNEKQTRDVLSNDSGQIIGSTFATGSDEFKPVQRGDRLYDMIERFYGVHGKDKMPTPDIEGLDAIKKNTDAMTNSLTNIENNKITSGLTVGDINVHCSGITSEQVGKEAGIKAYQEIYRAAFGLSNAARQHNTTVRKYT